MIRPRLTLLLLLSSAFAVGGCKNPFKKQDEQQAAASASVAPLPPALPVPAPPTPAAVQAPALDAPTPEDFEDEAFEKITAANFETELARLKKEIAP